MLTKTVNFDNDVLAAIRRMTWNNDGTSAVITDRLDRKLYEKVNKALELLGGRWSTKAKAHLFPVDPRPQVEGLLDNGSLTVKKEGFFRTPPEVIELMIEALELAPFSHIILEPSAGDGAILKAIARHYKDREQLCPHLLHFCEINPQRVALAMGSGAFVAEDFMKYDLPRDEDGEPKFMYDRIIMNPPFEDGQDISHVRHAYDLLEPEGILVAIMSEGPFFRQDDQARAFRAWLSNVNGTSRKLPEGSFKSSGTGVNTRLVIIHKI
jgi:type I restriction-modification system DNA methylase subunit